MPLFSSAITYSLNNYALDFTENTALKTRNLSPWNHFVGNTGVKDMHLMSNMQNKPSKSSEERQTTLTWGQSVDKI